MVPHRDPQRGFRAVDRHGTGLSNTIYDDFGGGAALGDSVSLLQPLRTTESALRSRHLWPKNEEFDLARIQESNISDEATFLTSKEWSEERRSLRRCRPAFIRRIFAGLHLVAPHLVERGSTWRRSMHPDNTASHAGEHCQQAKTATALSPVRRLRGLRLLQSIGLSEASFITCALGGPVVFGGSETLHYAIERRVPDYHR